MSASECTKRWQQKNRKAGLCRCANPLPKGKNNCERCAASHKKWRKNNKEKVRTAERTRYWMNPEKGRTKLKEKAKALKDSIFIAYGGYRCACCNETIKEFLQIDHIAGGGNKHRREIAKNRKSAGPEFYRWLAKNNFPEGYQVLCANCNWGKRILGICPHKLGATQTHGT